MDEDQVLNNEEEQAEARYLLDEMEVSSVGLVPKGANLMPGFILLKNDKEASMTEKVDIEEVVPEDAPEEVKGILKQVGDGIASLFQKAQDAEPEVTDGDDQPEPGPEETPPEPAPAERCAESSGARGRSGAAAPRSPGRRC